MNYEIINLKNKKEIIDIAATWFSSKWNIPKNEYLNSINESINSNAPYPSWYIALSNNKIIGGIGVIQNDFHERKDLYPNVCALFVEPEYLECMFIKLTHRYFFLNSSRWICCSPVSELNS